ncbi:PAS domain-containing protein [Bradyrhizobium sp. U87765 SZCCT0131]|uniref:PAS domain-containing protein n=1 Tax=unclassified Bradyrhizobium TaxID=2631580 RepID=UPI001BAD6C64|nr:MULTISPECIES: PAS domain-containing protein [unclassified Bradyrhizobium]MBR1220898.1 PAS domain-containing protein [Bradyrhizobium sp. U87765 SZCCT0131]MBR1260282.1 PAS domain-containing protein [Bradyrhizobium sp. U87765 SZCCT0134]MBR1307469.1 PAS domain-containing protein [Bradyrhizobium sp. U87765 SZCCT0110]MBR1321423.1 PAS domain-containing protein [Bradyrhizobium sp. U87765 SZCCT0109]MBR1349736.1 PAS domain-containing protein [Bradyrhizobium sp. U87765 SZCCT0048]
MSDKDRIEALGDHIQAGIVIASQLNHGFLKQLLTMALLELIETRPDFGEAKIAPEPEVRKGFGAETFRIVGAWDWDVAADRVYADPEVARLFGIDEEEAATGTTVQSFMPRIVAEDVGHVRQLIDQAMLTGGAYRATYRLMQPDGDVTHVLAVGRVMLDDKQKAVRFPGTILELQGSEGSFAYDGPEPFDTRRFEGIATLPRRRID